MAVNKVSGVSWADISKVAGAAKADISKIGGAETATVITWGVTGQDGATGYATSTDYTVWDGYRDPNTSTDSYYIAYGKDGNGDPLWIRGATDNNREMMYSTDITSDGTWNSLNFANPNDKYRIIWGQSESKWVAAGEMATTVIKGLATNGTGTWIIGQDDKVFTTNNLAAGSVGWVLLKDFSDTRDIIMAGYAAGKWFVTYRDFKPGGGDGEGVANAPAADSGSWTDGPDINIGGAIPANTKNSAYATSTASADYATIIIVNSSVYCRSTDSGATFTKHAGGLSAGNARSIATDGQGNWMVGHDDSKVSYSTDDGTTFSAASTGISWDSGGASDIDGIAASVLLPV